MYYNTLARVQKTRGPRPPLMFNTVPVAHFIALSIITDG